LSCLAVTRIGGSCVLSDGLTAVGGVCAWAFTHQSDSTTAIDAKKSDSIAAPEPDDGSPTDHPHHETVSMMLSIKVHTPVRRRAAMRVKRRAHRGKLRFHGGALKRHSRHLVSTTGSVPAHRRGHRTAVSFIVNI